MRFDRVTITEINGLAVRSLGGLDAAIVFIQRDLRLDRRKRKGHEFEIVLCLISSEHRVADRKLPLEPSARPRMQKSCLAANCSV